jgi:RNA polymerase sigma factor (sigma-70 family)
MKAGRENAAIRVSVGMDRLVTLRKNEGARLRTGAPRGLTQVPLATCYNCNHADPVTIAAAVPAFRVPGPRSATFHLHALASRPGRRRRRMSSAAPNARDPGSLQEIETTDEYETSPGFVAFVRDHQEALIAFLRKRANEEDARDMAQEAMVRLMRYRNQPHAQLRALMYRIALNVFNDRGRRGQSHHVAVHVSFDDDMLTLPSTELAHDERIDNEQTLARVRDAILRLPPRCRQVYLLNRIEGMRYAEVARHCGISVKAVEKHIGKALQVLRDCLPQDASGNGGPR